MKSIGTGVNQNIKIQSTQYRNRRTETSRTLNSNGINLKRKSKQLLNVITGRPTTKPPRALLAYEKSYTRLHNESSTLCRANHTDLVWLHCSQSFRFILLHPMLALHACRRMCVGSFARANTWHPQAEEAERQKEKGTAAHRSETGSKSPGNLL